MSIHTSELYAVVLNRKDLDSVIEHFASAGLADVLVDESGQILFNIKKGSSLKIIPHRPATKLIREIKKLRTRLSKLGKEAPQRKKLEVKLKHYESALNLVILE